MPISPPVHTITPSISRANTPPPNEQPTVRQPTKSPQRLQKHYCSSLRTPPTSKPTRSSERIFSPVVHQCHQCHYCAVPSYIHQRCHRPTYREARKHHVFRYELRGNAELLQHDFLIGGRGGGREVAQSTGEGGLIATELVGGDIGIRNSLGYDFLATGERDGAAGQIRSNRLTKRHLGEMRMYTRVEPAAGLAKATMMLVRGKKGTLEGESRQDNLEPPSYALPGRKRNKHLSRFGAASETSPHSQGNQTRCSKPASQISSELPRQKHASVQRACTEDNHQHHQQPPDAMYVKQINRHRLPSCARSKSHEKERVTACMPTHRSVLVTKKKNKSVCRLGHP